MIHRGTSLRAAARGNERLEEEIEEKVDEAEQVLVSVPASES
jgi:hypothetical protein